LSSLERGLTLNITYRLSPSGTMSLWARCKTKINTKVFQSNPEAKKLLVEAIQEAVKELTGRECKIVEKGIVRGFGRCEEVDLLVELPHRWGNGFGVKFTSEGLELVGDTHGLEITYKRSLDEFAAKIQEKYVEKAITYAMNRLGYMMVNSSVREDARELVFVKYF